MSIRDDYKQAVELAKEGKFKEARSLIIGYDHPKTDALLKKINAAIAADKPNTSVENEQIDDDEAQKNTGIGCALMLIAVVACTIYLAFPSDSTTSNNTTSDITSMVESNPSQSQDEQDVSALETALLFSEGVDIVDVSIADGRDNGGERTAIVGFITSNDNAGLGSVIGAIGAGAREFNIDIDNIMTISGPDADTVTRIAVVSYDDVILYLDGRINAETLYNRITIE